MQPDQPLQPGNQGPQPSYPGYGSGSAQPGQQASGTPQQSPGNTYQVVPPIPSVPNNGHSGHNPYEFIVAPQKPKAKGLRFGLGSGNPFIMRIVVILGAVVVLMIIVAIVLSALAPKGSTPGLTAIAERQQEIIRVADMASGDAIGQDTRNFVANIEASITSDQQQVLGYLSGHGVKVDPKVLALDHDSKTDTLLDDAASAGSYDATAAQVLSDQLVTYQDLIRTTYKQTTSKQAKQLLQSIFDSTNKLAQQAKALLSDNN